MPLGEERFIDFERRIKASFKTFNEAVSRDLEKYVAADFVDWGSLQMGFRPLVQHFAADLTNVMILGANLSAKDASQIVGRNISFDPTGFAAIATMAELKQRVIAALQAQQAEALMEMRRIANQVTPIRSAKMIKETLTLTGRQVSAIDNFRRMLEDLDGEALRRKLRDKRFDPTIARAIDTNTGLTTDQVDRMVSRYAERQLAFRAETIAATEAVRIANEAEDLFYRQAVEQGDLEEEQILRKWVTSKDEKVRPSHRFAQGQIRGLKEQFITGDGNLLRFPGDPRAPASDTIRCRCWVSTDVKELGLGVGLAVAAAG